MSEVNISIQPVFFRRTMQKVFLISLILFIFENSSVPLGGLYSLDDDVEILNADNFKNIVENSTSAWLIEFYVSWCGYCQRFSTPWKGFATEVASWRDVVRVGVLDCSDEKNTDFCEDFGVTKYPTLKYFHENFVTGSGNVGVIVPHGDSDKATPDSLKMIAIEKLITEMREGRGKMYPNLLPYDEPNDEKIFEGIGDDIEFNFLIVEPSSKVYLGAAIALELYRTPKISVRYSWDNNTKLLENLKIEKIPTVVVSDRQNNFQKFDKNVTNREEIKATIKAFLENKGLRIDETIPPKVQKMSDRINNEPKVNATIILREHIKNMGDVIFQSDLEAAIRYSLQHEVATVKTIKNEKLNALKDYLTILRKYFPFGANKTSLINNLINLTSNSEEIEGDLIKVLVKKAEDDQVFSSPQRFLGCQGSSVRFRGYPCSLWRLFHYMTVHSVRYNSNNTNANPIEVLGAMLGYVIHFFSCEHCSKNFEKMASERNLTDVSSLKDSVIWLWDSHNIVNDRLKGDASEDPEHPKEQFPTKSRCPECYKNDGSWNIEKVRKYLNRMYSIYNIRYIGADTKIIFPELQ